MAALAFIGGGSVIAAVGVFFWNHPEVYDKYFHENSVWYLFGSSTPVSAVKVGAALTVVIGVLAVAWGLVELAG